MFNILFSDFYFNMETFDYLGLTFKVRTLDIIDIRELSSFSLFTRILSEKPAVSDADSSGFLSVTFKTYDDEVEKNLHICVCDPILNLSLDTILDALDIYLLLVHTVQVTGPH